MNILTWRGSARVNGNTERVGVVWARARGRAERSRGRGQRGGCVSCGREMRSERVCEFKNNTIRALLSIYIYV